MRPKLLFIFLLIALLPVILLAWMGVRIVNAERDNLERGLGKLYLGKLKDHDATVQKVINSRKRELVKVANDLEGRNNLPSLLRELVGRTTSVSHFFILDKKGNLLFPADSMALSQDEQNFLQRTRKIWEGKLIPVKNGETHLQRPAFNNSPAVQSVTNNAPVQQEIRQQIFQSGYNDQQQKKIVHQKGLNVSDSISFKNGNNSEGLAIPETGWIGWFWESGIHLIYWIRLDDGRIFGAELDRADLIADIIAELPGTDPFNEDSVSERVILVDASDKAVYQWGVYDVENKIDPAAVYPLSFPLNTWKLKFYPGDSADAANFAKSSILNLSIMLSLIGIIFIFLAIYFYREHSREMREAATRVSFVNRVSHEFKTPLTNIRMYAELLNSQIDNAGAKEKKQLAVITGESERLSRLITNVLTFSKGQKGKLQLRKKEGCIDEIVKHTIDRFDPVLKQSDITVTSEFNAQNRVNVDSDILEQILVNLISNIEKYASSGKSANIATRLEGNYATITVSDSGPGIAAKFADSVFQPFYRLDNKLSEGTSGTGIGLNIARELARKHGGDIKLIPSEKGAVFEVTLEIGRK